jgi:hypothetical protein
LKRNKFSANFETEFLRQQQHEKTFETQQVFGKLLKRNKFSANFETQQIFGKLLKRNRFSVNF